MIRSLPALDWEWTFRQAFGMSQEWEVQLFTTLATFGAVPITRTTVPRFPTSPRCRGTTHWFFGKRVLLPEAAEEAPHFQSPAGSEAAASFQMDLELCRTLRSRRPGMSLTSFARLQAVSTHSA